MLTPYEYLWLYVAPGMAASWYHIFRHWRGFVREAPEVANPHPHIIFQFAARAASPLLQGCIDYLHHSCADAGYTNYEVKVVLAQAGDPLEGAETMVVPADFKCLSRFKARQLHYALDSIPCSRDVWILHLDEDAKVTAQGVRSMIKYIKGGGNPIAQGPTVFPSRGSLLTFLAEAHRHWNFYWLQDQMSTYPLWLNGSNLLVRSDVEHAIGWDFGVGNTGLYISEDSRFGYEATRKLGWVFGWHGGLTIEDPPGSVSALIKQRKRWFYGSLLNFPRTPRRLLLRRIYSITCWESGLFLTVGFFLGFLGKVLPGNLVVADTLMPVFLFTALFWRARYLLGLHWNMKYMGLSRKRKLLYYVALAVLTPVVELLCTLPTFLALIRPPRSFEITEKKGDTKHEDSHSRGRGGGHGYRPGPGPFRPSGELGRQ